MKKYVKPDVAFEGFELSQHIAGGCGVIINSAKVESCQSTGEGDLNLGVVGLFLPEAQCVVDGTGYGEYCYYNHEGFGLMNS